MLTTRGVGNSTVRIAVALIPKNWAKDKIFCSHGIRKPDKALSTLIPSYIDQLFHAPCTFMRFLGLTWSRL